MPTRIKFQTTDTQPFIMLPTYLNGKGPFDFVLDTGASMSIVTEELAGLIGIEGKEPKEALGAAGKRMTTFLGRVDSVSIGETKVKNLEVGIMNELPKCVGRGAIGYNFLKDFILTIDYRSNLLTITSPLDVVSHQADRRTSIPFRLAKPDRPILLVDVLVNAHRTYPFILDTGASQTVVSPNLAQQMKLINTQLGPTIGAGGKVQSSMGRLTSLTLGEAALENMMVVVADIFSALGQAVEASIDGILGYTFLREFKLEINYPSASLCVDA